MKQSLPNVTWRKNATFKILLIFFIQVKVWAFLRLFWETHWFEDCWGSVIWYVLILFIIYPEHVCLTDRQSQLWIWKAIYRSGLLRHMLKLVVGWEDYVAYVRTMSSDMIKLQLSQHFCRATKILCCAKWVSCRLGVTLCYDFYTFNSCFTCILSLTNCAV